MGSLKYVGALHTSDAEEPQLKEIEKQWASFNPTVAFCEGRSRHFRFASRPATGTLSESDLVRILANQNGVKLFTLEPRYEDEVAGLLEEFDPKRIAAYMTLRVFTSEASGSTANKENIAVSLMKKRTDVAGLQGTFSSIQEFDSYWAKEFGDSPDWRTIQDVDSIPQLRKVGDVSREIRGQHMVSSISELVSQGERVFAVVGASHVIRQEPVLENLLTTAKTN